MRLFGYGLRRALPGWAYAAGPLLGALLWARPLSSAGELLGLAGLVDPAGAERARLWSLLGLLGLTLATWRAAALGARLAGPDRMWIAPRPARRSALAGGLVAGVLVALAGYVGLVAAVVELGVGGGAGRQLLVTPSGPAVLRTAAEPASARHAEWELETSNLAAGARLELLVRPLAGQGRSARLSLRTTAAEQHFDIGAVRRISIALDPVAGKLELEHGPDGPPLALFPGDARITRPVASSHLASLVLGLRTWLLMLVAAGLALGLGTRLTPGLAALSCWTVLLGSSLSGDALGSTAWTAALTGLEQGWIAPWPALELWAAALAALAFGVVLAARAMGARAAKAHGRAT